MGLAPYGEPSDVDEILDKLMILKADAHSVSINLTSITVTGLTMTTRFAAFSPAGPQPEDSVTPFHMNIAAIVQAVTERS